MSDMDDAIDRAVSASEKRKKKKKKRKGGAAAETLRAKRGENHQNLGSTVSKIRKRKYEQSQY